MMSHELTGYTNMPKNNNSNSTFFPIFLTLNDIRVIPVFLRHVHTGVCLKCYTES